MANPPIAFDAADIALLYRVSRALLHEREYGDLLADVLDAAIDGLGADRGFVVVRDTGGFRVTVARNFRSEALEDAEQEISRSIAAAVVEHGRALLVDDAQDAVKFRDNPSVQRMGLRSLLCAPLVASDEAFALIYLENRDIAHRFTERHRALLDEICALASPRLRVAVSVEDARKRARLLEGAAGESDGIWTADAGMAAVLRTVRQIAPTDLPVLVQGETGTGKELVARAVYRHSSRSRGPFVVLNCAAIPASLMESELFGHARGAFTGAVGDRIGLIASANRGTLFLDEVGELPLELQSRLLRVLQSGEVMRIGSTRVEHADVRLIAATNRDLEREVDEGRFRSDLYFRLASITVKVPPLRERRADVHLLADRFVRAYAARFAREAPRLGDEAMRALDAYSFPGNVRELESEMARLVAMTPPGATIAAAALNDRIQTAIGAAARKAHEPADALPPMSIEEMEKRLIRSVLASTDGNRTRAAEVLGISREGLRTKMQRLGLNEVG